jgi:lipid A ethanolaminephosphotransferase
MIGVSSIIQNAITPYFKEKKAPIKIVGEITKHENLIVALVIGESARQKNFSLYGYSRKNTNPQLSRYQDLHLLNGNAKQGSTINALPEILEKNGIKLTEITSKLGVKTSCLVHFTLYGNCASIGEIETNNCAHNGQCYDEDVLPLLADALEGYKSGYQFTVLHLGGGSHGPIYQKRFPEEFQIFKPQCSEANVMGHCSKEQLYNSYDNSILYTDYVLDGIITQLDKKNEPYVFIYLSDHGESLMEGDRVFHGHPTGISLPKEQAEIPLIVRASVPISIVKRKKYEQQDVFDTVLELFSIKTPLISTKNAFIKKH